MKLFTAITLLLSVFCFHQAIDKYGDARKYRRDGIWAIFGAAANWGMTIGEAVTGQWWAVPFSGGAALKDTADAIFAPKNRKEAEISAAWHARFGIIFLLGGAGVPYYRYKKRRVKNQ